MRPVMAPVAGSLALTLAAACTTGMRTRAPVIPAAGGREAITVTDAIGTYATR